MNYKKVADSKALRQPLPLSSIKFHKSLIINAFRNQNSTIEKLKGFLN
ncbi:MAG: hypothetical protein RIS64_43 [Bacteroidota bacterium]|jgi:hypothetical protein